MSERSVLVMSPAEVIARGEARLARAMDGPRTRGLTLRSVVHLLRPQIAERRRAGATWAQLAGAICDEFGFACADPKEVGRALSQYHREPLSKAAYAAVTAGPRHHARGFEARASRIAIARHRALKRPACADPRSSIRFP